MAKLIVALKVPSAPMATSGPRRMVTQGSLTHFALFEAIRHGRFRQAQLLVDAGADVNSRDDDGCTPLISACMHSEPSRSMRRICKLLLDAQADPNGRDGKGRTSLMHAAAIGSKELVLVLLDYKQTDLALQDVNGNTALMYAAKMGHEHIVLVLLSPPHYNSNACRPNMQNFSGRTAAQLANSNGHTQIELALRVYNSESTKPEKRITDAFTVDDGRMGDLNQYNDLSEPRKGLISRQVQTVLIEEADAHPPSRPPTPAHLHLLPSLDLNASQSSTKSEPGTIQPRNGSRRRRRVPQLGPSTSRSCSELNSFIDESPSKRVPSGTGDAFEELVDLLDASVWGDEDQRKRARSVVAKNEVRLPPILQPNFHSFADPRQGNNDGVPQRRKSHKWRTEDETGLKLLDAK